MMKKTRIQHTLWLLAAAFGLAGCADSSTSDNKSEYLVVQVDLNDNWSIIDAKGEYVVKEEFAPGEEVSQVYGKLFWVKSGEKIQLYSIDSPKKPLNDEEYTGVTAFCAGRAAVCNGKEPIQIINTEGSVVATLPRDICRVMTYKPCGLAPIMKNDGKMGWIDRNGVVMAEGYETVNIANDPIIVARQDPATDTFYLILDEKGQKLGKIEASKYEWGAFSEGLCAQQNGEEEDRWLTYIDKEGKEVLKVKKARSGSDFLDGFARVWNAEGREGIINKEGELLIRPKYNTIQNLGQGMFLARKMNSDNWGVINDKDETIVSFEYSDYYHGRLGDNFILKDGELWTVIGMDGKAAFKESFASIANGASSDLVEYIDIESAVNHVLDDIVNQDFALTPSLFVKQQSAADALDIEEVAKSSSKQFRNQGLVSGLSFVHYFNFKGCLAEEKTHEVQKNDGWFTTTERVSDGYQWTNHKLNDCGYDITIASYSFSQADIEKFIDKKAREMGLQRDNNYHGMPQWTKKDGKELVRLFYRMTDDILAIATIKE
jgi:hypothetical protein